MNIIYIYIRFVYFGAEPIQLRGWYVQDHYMFKNNTYTVIRWQNKVYL